MSDTPGSEGTCHTSGHIERIMLNATRSNAKGPATARGRAQRREMHTQMPGTQQDPMRTRERQKADTADHSDGTNKAQRRRRCNAPPTTIIRARTRVSGGDGGGG